MSHKSALILTIVIMVGGIAVCTALAQTPAGQGLINVLSFISLGLGIAYLVDGGRSGNVIRLGSGLLLCILAFGTFGLPDPLNAGLQLFFGLVGLLIRLP